MEGEIPRESSLNSMRADLQKAGFVFVRQVPGETSVIVEGQRVDVPFTNMSRIEVILRNKNGGWEYTGFRGLQNSEELGDYIRLQHKWYQEELSAEKP